MSTRSVEEIQASAPFEIKGYHKKALLVLLRCHHSDGDPQQGLTYSQLSIEVGVGEKTKAWQSVAYKDLKSNEYIVPGSGNKTWTLSPRGVELATTFASDEELKDYQKAMTNEEHHEKLKAKLVLRTEKGKKFAPKIFDHFVAVDSPMTKHEIAGHFNTLADSHGFFYGFQALQKAGLIAKAGQASNDNQNYAFSECGKVKKKAKLTGGQEWQLTDKAFLNGVGRKIPVEETTTTTTTKQQQQQHQQPVNVVKEEKGVVSDREEPSESTKEVVKVKEEKDMASNKKTQKKKKKSVNVKGKVLAEEKNDFDDEQHELEGTDAAVKKDDEELEDEFKYLDDEEGLLY